MKILNKDIPYCRSIFTLLPEELQQHVWGYVTDQRKNYSNVIDEMVLRWMTDVCDNDICYSYINCNTAVEGEINGVRYNYCSNYCENYDSWIHKYDYITWNNRRVQPS